MAIPLGRPSTPPKPWLTDNYRRYLESDEWRAVRSGALERARHRCARCGSTDDLHVHHVSYTRLGYERPDDLTVLCAACHELEHRRRDRERLDARRLDGWASKRWGENWASYVDIERASVEFEDWLERRGD